MFSAPRTTARGDLIPSAVLGLLGTRGPTSRAEIARRLAVSPATVTQVTQGLIRGGLVEEREQMPSQGGRPARLLGLVSTQVGAIGAKVTADHVAIVHVGLDGSVHTATVKPYNPDDPDAVHQLAELLTAEVAVHPGRLLGIGVGIPGAVDTQESGVVDACTLGWTAVHVGDVLRAATGVPVLMENDVNTLAVAHALYGEDRQQAGTYLVITIGRGIGSGIVVDGSVYRGSHGGAGEIGHFPIDAGGPECTCGNRGCLEALIGDDALLRTAAKAGITGTDTPAALAAAADSGDSRARQIYRNAGVLLGRTLAGVAQLVDPTTIVVSGEGIGTWPHWRPGFEVGLRSHLMPSRRSLPVTVSPWSEDRWAVGAAALVLATPFDSIGTAGRQGELVRERLHLSPEQREVSP